MKLFSKLCFILLIVFFSNDGYSQTTQLEICDWCTTDQEFISFAELRYSAAGDGDYTFLVGNPFTGDIREVFVTVDREQGQTIVIAILFEVSPALKNDFQEAGQIMTDESIFVVPLGACVHCNSYSDSTNEPDFYSYLHINHAHHIINDLRSLPSLLVNSIAAALGRYHDIVVVFPNGDSVKVTIKALVGSPSTSYEHVEGTAVDADGNPLDGDGDTSHHQGSSGSGGGALGGFYVRIRPNDTDGEQWYVCAPDGNGGIYCVEIPPPDQQR